MVPLFVHGDGGRTYRSEELMCVQFQPALGLGTRKSHPVRVISGKAGVNMRGHSFTTRFLYGVMQKSLYKDDPHTFQVFLERLMENFEGLYFQARFVILGLKGDLPEPSCTSKRRLRILAASPFVAVAGFALLVVMSMRSRTFQLPRPGRRLAELRTQLPGILAPFSWNTFPC